jgi:hypothetical protein
MNRVFPMVTKIKCMKAGRKVSTADVAACSAAAEEHMPEGEGGIHSSPPGTPQG